VPHISSYALTVEPKNWQSFIKRGIIKNVDDDKKQELNFIFNRRIRKG
jgi:oxygen-independent coproporphyrinogen-3 oxidase